MDQNQYHARILVLDTSLYITRHAFLEDNGIGVDEVTQRHLFEPFFTTKDADRGKGLGLWIIYAIVRNHDREITVESEQPSFLPKRTMVLDFITSRR